MDESVSENIKLETDSSIFDNRSSYAFDCESWSYFRMF